MSVPGAKKNIRCCVASGGLQSSTSGTDWLFMRRDGILKGAPLECMIVHSLHGISRLFEIASSDTYRLLCFTEPLVSSRTAI